MLLPILPQVLEVSCPRKDYSGTIDSKAGDSSFTSHKNGADRNFIEFS